MRALWLVALLIHPFQEPTPVDAVKAAIETTAKSSYAYRVGGRFKREGVFVPPDLLTARIDGFQSARNGTTILVKGPEGLWKSPEERFGEQVEGTPPEVGDKVTTLREAERPHEMLAVLLADVKSGRALETPGTYLFTYDPEKVRAYLRKEMDKAVDRKTLARPDVVAWESAEGRLRVQLEKLGGPIAKFSEERSVPIRYKREGESEDRRRYRTEMVFELLSHGEAKVELPDEVRKRLGLK
ncbi:MAG TPA: hypothetical protein VJU16_03385 [Planctomycetota bacterium]|nr:hypothetical protein [Planctomycetota bacterium]